MTEFEYWREQWRTMLKEINTTQREHSLALGYHEGTMKERISRSKRSGKFPEKLKALILQHRISTQQAQIAKRDWRAVLQGKKKELELKQKYEGLSGEEEGILDGYRLSLEKKETHGTSKRKRM